MICITLADIADSITIAGAVAAAGVAWTAARNARRVVESHLRSVRAWAGGFDGKNGWPRGQITLVGQIAWLDPTQTIFRIASGPALIQMTMWDRLTLHRSQINALVTLNQSIESFNAVLNKAESLRTAHAISLARIHPEVVRRAEESRPAGQIPDLSAVLGWLANDDRLVAETVINLLTMLHEGMIGVPGGNGLCEAFRAAAAQFDAT